jgi:hypothetical protein
VSSDELTDGETLWSSSREDLLPSSTRGFSKGLAPAPVQSAAVWSSIGIDNLVFCVKDECTTRPRSDDIFLQCIDPKLAVKKLGSHGNTEKSVKELSLNAAPSTKPVSVELTCLTSGPEVHQDKDQLVLLEELEQPAGTLQEDVVDWGTGNASNAAYFRSRFGKEAWASTEDQEESSLSSLDVDEVKVSQLLHIFCLHYGGAVIFAT